MITTTRHSGHLRGRNSRCQRSICCRLFLQLIILALLAGCTNSKLLVGPLYNQLDDRIRSKFIKLGDFNAAQTDSFEQAVGTFHVWHRQSELPKYAALLQNIASSIIVPGRTTGADVERWINTADGLFGAVRACYPVNFLSGTVRTLTDEQLMTIQNRFTEERRKNRKRHGSRTPEERVAFRLKNLDKWAGRIELELTQAQRKEISDSLSRQISLRTQYHALSDAWSGQFFTMARDQEADDYEARMQMHLGRFGSLLETAYPDEWQANRRLWTQTLQSFIQSLNSDQRRNISQWVDTMGRTLQAISQDHPSFKPGTDARVGCLVENGS